MNHNLTTKQEKEETANDSFALSSNSNLPRKRRMSEENTAEIGNKISRVSCPGEGMGWNVPPNMQVKAQPDRSLIEDEPCHTEGAKVPPIPEDPVKKFYKDIAGWVMKCLNTYYLYNNNATTCQRKIQDQHEYQELAKSMSHSHRKREKESYLSYYGNLDGLQLNLDMKERIKFDIDRFFENKPLLPMDQKPI